jgi:hypothetical protein
LSTILDYNATGNKLESASHSIRGQQQLNLCIFTISELANNTLAYISACNYIWQTTELAKEFYQHLIGLSNIKIVAAR